MEMEAWNKIQELVETIKKFSDPVITEISTVDYNREEEYISLRYITSMEVLQSLKKPAITNPNCMWLYDAESEQERQKREYLKAEYKNEESACFEANRKLLEEKGYLLSEEEKTLLFNKNLFTILDLEFKVG